MKKKENLITAVTIRGYKSIRDELRMEFKPLTVLAGANSSGKSSFVQPLLLLKQTLEAPFDPGVFMLNGPNVRFTSAEQLLSIGGKPKVKDFTLGLEAGENTKIKITYKNEGRGRGFDIERMDLEQDGQSHSVTPNITHEDIIKIIPGQFKKLHEDFLPSSKGELHWVVQRERCFFSFALVSESSGRSWQPLYHLSNIPVPHIKGIVHVPGLRGNPARNYVKTTSVGPDFPGTFENYVASVVAHWQINDAPKLDELGKTLKDLGLSWKVEAKSLDDTQVELRIGRLVQGKRGGAHDMVSIADVGFGVSQTLPVLVALLVARPGQMVYLEQPEIHLHPLAQRRLAGVLAAAAKRGVRVVVETHSTLLLREIQTMVARGDLASNMVKLNWFKRSPKDGVTELYCADLDDNGAFGEDWPEDFDATQLAAENDYLNAVEARNEYGQTV